MLQLWNENNSEMKQQKQKCHLKNTLNLGQWHGMKCPSIVGTIILHPNITSIRNSMNCANLAYTLYHQTTQMNYSIYIQEPQLPLRNRASAMHFFVPKLHYRRNDLQILYT